MNTAIQDSIYCFTYTTIIVTQGQSSKLSRTYVATQVQCVLCHGSHRLFRCEQFLHMSVKQRLNYVRHHKLCFNCLQLYTRGHTCSKNVCHHCSLKHHTLLHVDRQGQQHDTRSSRNKLTVNGNGPSANQNLTSNVQGNVPTEVSTYCTFKGKPKHQTLLATAIVELRNKSGQYVPCRALSDNASQAHFITERCVQRLKLSKIQTHSSIQGISNSSATANHCVSIHMRSQHTDWHDNLNCAVLSDITGSTPASKLDVTNWKIPPNVKLADQNFNIPAEIDLLIGAELFYELLQSGRRTRPGYPVLQETVLGWTVSGRTPVNTSQ